ncbi:MAG: zinc ribbon domain-containing protein [Lachnospiraceae bacterium]|nr:zinc ribbon domain-containing protein [Lachnospiraceae bacterium]
MDVNVLNAVVSGQEKICPGCGARNQADSRFCFACGTSLIDVPVVKEEAETAAETAFETVKETATESAFAPVKEEVKEEVKESAAAFAPADNNTPAFGAAKKRSFLPPTGAGEVKAETGKEDQPAAAFNPVKKREMPVKNVEEKAAPKEVKPAFEAAKPQKASQKSHDGWYKEPEAVFAQGLPEWTIEPPQVMVRRKKH